MTEISGDSGEYEFLTEAVLLSKDVPGLCCEVGLRLGMGTKTIMDAVAEYCPSKVVTAIDPYGSQLYKPRDHMPECRLDYTNGMRNECLGNMFPYSETKNVHFKFIELTDTDFFRIFADGVIIYDIDRFVVNEYSMVHLDGPHGIEEITTEVFWFNDRMKSGAILVIDDISIDFIDIKPINQLLISLGWEILKQGFKKGLYKKC